MLCYHRPRTILVHLACAFLAAVAFASPPPSPTGSSREGREVDPIELYDKVSAAIVGIYSFPDLSANRKDGNFHFGTGTIVHPDGIILTSVTVVPEGTKLIQVLLSGGRTVEAETVLGAPEKEMVLLRVLGQSGGGRRFPFLHLGSSARTRIGQLAFALGNSFESIWEDDQVSFTAGVLSGSYVLGEARGESPYIGRVLETSTTVNPGMDGGPLIDARGEVLGLLSLNYSRNRWLGTAVPVDLLKPRIAPRLDIFEDRPEGFPAYIGIELIGENLEPPPAALPPGGSRPAVVAPEAAGTGSLRRPVARRVDPAGPAARAGIRPGDRIAVWFGSPLGAVTEFRDRFSKVRPGDRISLGIEGDAGKREVEITAWGNL